MSFLLNSTFSSFYENLADKGNYIVNKVIQRNLKKKQKEKNNKENSYTSQE